MGYIYIMTNPALQDMVKIGYASNVEQRRQQLSTTALPFEYEIYATYETQEKLEDKKLHQLIDKLNPALRVSENREFYVMTPDDAYRLLEAIAIISGSENKLDKIKPDDPQPPINQKRPAINFYKCGLKDGDELVYIEDSSIVVTVQGAHKVLYKDELTSLSTLVSQIKNVKAIQGTLFFTHNGERLIDIAQKTQWKDC